MSWRQLYVWNLETNLDMALTVVVELTRNLGRSEGWARESERTGHALPFRAFRHAFRGTFKSLDQLMSLTPVLESLLLTIATGPRFIFPSNASSRLLFGPSQITHPVS